MLVVGAAVPLGLVALIALAVLGLRVAQVRAERLAEGQALALVAAGEERATAQVDLGSIRLRFGPHRLAVPVRGRATAVAVRAEDGRRIAVLRP